MQSLVPDVPASVETVVVRCLAKHQADRFGSASDLTTALRATLSHTPLVNRRLLFVTLGMIAILIAGGIDWAVWPPQFGPAASSSAVRTDPPAPKSLIADGAMHFNGQTRIVTPLNRFAPCTLEAWVWPEEYTMTGTQMAIGGDIPTKYGIGLGVTGVVPCAEIIEGIVLAPKSFPLKQWSHLAAVFAVHETRLSLPNIGNIQRCFCFCLRKSHCDLASTCAVLAGVVEQDVDDFTEQD